MHIQIRPLQGYQKSLTYALPAHWTTQPIVGDIVTVPLRGQTILGMIEKMVVPDPNIPLLGNNGQVIKIRAALNHETTLNHQDYKIFMKNLSGYYQIPVSYLLKRFWGALTAPEAITENPKNSSKTKKTVLGSEHPSINSNNSAKLVFEQAVPVINLTTEQQLVFDSLVTQLDPKHRKFQANLIHGVTGSGKTEIYSKLIQANFELGYSTLFLLPEVSLATNFDQILRTKLTPQIPIFSFHSGTTITQKRALWDQIRQQKPILIIGVHLPVLLPITNLGLILIDEEHDPGFQEKKHPQINTKECALIRAKINQIPIVLGSATPSISSLYNIEKHHWKIFKLHQRYRGNFPEIKVVNLRESQHKQRTQNFWFSRELLDAIKARLNRQEQTIIFINRRGYSFFIQCHECGFIPNCPNCSVSLTLHADQSLHCHYCALEQAYPTNCASCKTSASKFLKKGLGTQQVVEILEKLFPAAKIARADLDITRSKKLWPQIVADFSDNQIDILVGTQTITKGYHFPHVTLVGILWADLNLHFPMYNAAETTLQQILQVAGRAGRQSPHSEVIVQTLTEHPIFNYLNESDYLKFYQTEIVNRTTHNYPPLVRLVELEIKHSSETQVKQDALILSTKLHAFAQKINSPNNFQNSNNSNSLNPQDQNSVHTNLNNLNYLEILGPSKPPISKIKNWHFRKIYLKSNKLDIIIQAWQYLQQKPVISSVFFTPNPLQ
ncbi:MAG TPA: primosomal protein N' [Candidatus Babeliales bacterium]|nr:primosomal protein N' [Candidatus Babeliales bacterium]